MLLGFSVLFLLSLACIYGFIPGEPVISKVVLVESSPNKIYKYLSEENNWARWWPRKTDSPSRTSGHENDSFKYDGYNYQLNQALFNAVEVHIRNKTSKIKTFVTIVSLKKDSVEVKWQFSFVASQNPVKRIQQHLQAKDLEENMEAILYALQSFLERKENVYGINIRQEKVKDTLLVATKLLKANYPSTLEINNLINNLRGYIIQQGASETNYPMVHVTTLDSSRFETMIAIPVNKALRDSGNFLFKRMVPGNILVTEVKGGRNTINKAFAQLENYLSDYRLETPAIPFESMVTDRFNEPDTTKWITRIYFPVY